MLLPQLHEVRRGEDVLRDPKQEERERDYPSENFQE
jgi:hypothetical protein